MAIYPFDHDHGVPARELADLLGGKGAGLAEMTRNLGVNVPPGFTVSLEVCREYRESGWPAWLDGKLKEHVDRLGDVMGRRLGNASDPLLVAVRSGAPISMPGMLDTVLNLGLNNETVQGLAAVSGDSWFAWDSFRRFLRMYAVIVMGASDADLPAGPEEHDAVSMQRHVAALQSSIVETTGRPVPHEPGEQLRGAVDAVFRSWECERARAYRKREGIDDQMGTAVNVQAMVFGNRGPESGTGVVFTRNPSTGNPVPYGDYLPCAQGEDVVAGTAHTMPINHLREHQPRAYEELVAVLRRLEVHYRDVCDVEFTLEEGHLWLLQTRVGKRSAAAAVRIAVDLTKDSDIRLTPAEALARVPAEIRDRARAEASSGSGGHDHGVFAEGLPASPGRATGRIVLNSDDAADADDDVILVRSETSPEDVAGMAASKGVLTTRGGLVSHAAVVARGWGIPAVVGAASLEVTPDGIRAANGELMRPGDVITIDGSTGAVWKGAAAQALDSVGSADALLPELHVLEEWARVHEKGKAMKIQVDRNKCTAMGICESISEDHFMVNDDGVLEILQPDVTNEEDIALAKRAVANCPNRALSLTEG